MVLWAMNAARAEPDSLGMSAAMISSVSSSIPMVAASCCSSRAHTRPDWRRADAGRLRRMESRGVAPLTAERSTGNSWAARYLMKVLRASR